VLEARFGVFGDEGDGSVRHHAQVVRGALEPGSDPVPRRQSERVVWRQREKNERRPAARHARQARSAELVAGEVGRGGIGRVLRACDLRLNRPVAIKELLGSAGEVAEERFIREALLTARLQHPSIVPLYEAGRWPSGAPFYAMKLVTGRSLEDVIAESLTLLQRLALLPHVLAAADPRGARRRGRDPVDRGRARRPDRGLRRP